MGVKEAFERIRANYIYVQEALEIYKEEHPDMTATTEVEPYVYNMMLIAHERKHILRILEEECPELKEEE